MKFKYLSSCCATLILLAACNKKQNATCDGSSPTYESAIKAIVSANCGTSSCHGSGSSNGDYTTYEKLKPVLDNGKFKSEVIDRQSMPKNGKLSSSDLSKIVCWKDSNYPEK